MAPAKPEVLRPPEPDGHYRGWFITVGLGLYDFVRTILVAFDILANVLTGGRRGDTISARSGRAMFRNGGPRWPWPRWWVEHAYFYAGLAPPDTSE